MSRIFLTGLTAFTLFGFTIAADGQDLKAAAARQKVAADKLTSRVNDAIEASRKGDPADASQTLRSLLNQVKDSPDLQESEKTELVRRLNARITVVDRSIRERTPPKGSGSRDVDLPKPKPVKDPRGGAGDVAKNWVDKGKSTQQTQADLIRQREANITKVNMGIEASAIPPDGRDISFPADWKERSERMKKLFGPQLTEKEVKLLKTLNSVMSVNYEDRSFKYVLGHLKDKTGLTIIVDGESLKELNIDYNDPVPNFDVEKASVRTILKKVFGDMRMTYIIKEGAIQVMTPEKAAKHTVLRSYNVGDLVLGDPALQAQVGQMFGPFGQKNLREQNALQLIQLIQAAIEPSYWQPNGPGTITYFDPTRSILIRASAEMHYQLESPGIFGGR